jgi:ribosomal protein S18 acetylase RimI-like enzyme
VCGASGFRMSETDYRPLRLERLQAVKNTLGWSEKTLNTFAERYEQVWQDPLDVTLKPSGEWTIECVAVLPEWRGKGVGKHLLEALEKRGLEQGCRSAGISVTVGNEAAAGLYQAVGFNPYITYWASYYNGYFPGTAKYTKTLTETGSGGAVWK